MRQRASDAVAPLELPTSIDESGEFMDEDEQEKLVQSFEAANAQADRTWRICFGAITMGLIGFFLWAAYSQSVTPWGTKYHAPFYHVTKSDYVVAADVTAAAAFLALLLFLMRQGWRDFFFRIGALSGVGLAAFWVYNLSQVPGPRRWDLLWLPAAIPVYTLLVVYVERTFASTKAEIEQLRARMYNFKAL